MGERLFIFVWLFGGFVVAFACLLFATIARSIRPLKWLSLAGALCGLIYEAGCFSAASEFSRATGNGSDGGSSNTVLGIAFLVASIWAIAILLWAAADVDSQRLEKQNEERR
jgi:uncharacterized BrkB/YihY/UPF0761 family membrane protein